jgi:predicted transcriptional regulator
MAHNDTDAALIRVGREISKLRKHSRMTQAVLARKLHVGQDIVTRMEKGQYDMLLSTLFRIANIFGRRLKISFVKRKGGA